MNGCKSVKQKGAYRDAHGSWAAFEQEQVYRGVKDGKLKK